MSRRVAVVAAVSLLFALPACSADKSDNEQAAKTPAKTGAQTLTVQSVNGTGCPASTATTATGPDLVVVSYSAFQVTSGSLTGLKSCQVNVLVSPGAGYQAAVTATEHSGTATLPGSVASRIWTTYYITAGSNLAVTKGTLSDPSWYVNQAAPATVVTPCGQDTALNVKADLGVGSPGASASAAGSTVHFDWRSC